MIRRGEGAVAIVTGGASGIGRALAAELGRRGADVVLADRDGEGLATVVDAVDGAEGHQVDVTDPAAVADLIDGVFSRHGRLDLLFNNAGIGVAATAAEHTLDDWQRVLDVNVRGVVHGVRAALPRMIEQGFGHVVNTASVAGLVPCGLMSSYVASKHAVVGLSLATRIELAGTGVHVTALCPGAVRTAILDGGRYGRMSDDLDRGRVLRLWEKLRPEDPGRFARTVLRRLERAPGILVVPGRYRMIWWLQRLAPGPMERLHRWGYGEVGRRARL